MNAKTTGHSIFLEDEMEELVKLVAQKTGLPPQTAEVVVKTVLDLLKQKLPAPLAGQLDDALKGSGVAGAVANALEDGKLDASDAANLLGGLFGKK